jgi:hypothetical protein
MDLSNVTIAIPLHRSLEYKDIVLGNIDRLAGHCKIILSDCTEEDNLLKDLEIQFRAVKNVRTIGKRSLSIGWLPHWNDLMNEVKTEYFMWLSHDDEIDLDWVSANLQNLMDNPEFAGSFGLLVQILEDGSLKEFGDRLPSTTRNNRKNLANQLIGCWNLGIATRAVWIKSKVLPFLRTQDPMDEWGDVIWIYGILLEHPISQVSTVSYRKRWYEGSAHSYWRGLDIVLARNLLQREIERRNLPSEISAELFEICVNQLTFQVNQLNVQVNQLNVQVNQLNVQRNEFLNSKSWRITSPLRALMRLAKWAQTGSNCRPTD